ncbi:MAG: hypothetical protein N2746_10010 [Deltaproteobacteria bacterium]|nr:hypothetical protein [Deltaproteobacteria bacterium]
MKLKIMITLSILVFTVVNGYSSDRPYQSWGMALSSFSGSGLSYRYHFENKWGLQITGGAIISDEHKNYAIGLEMQSDLTSIKDKRVYLIASLGWYGETEEVFPKNGKTYETINVDIDYYKIAIGLGGELAFGNSIVNNLSLGIAIFPIGIAIKERHSYPGYDDTSEVGFGASIFSHFNF